MNDLEKKIRAAAKAGWWTLLIGAGMLAMGWLSCLSILSAQPASYLALLGQGATWADFQHICLWAIVAFKLILWVFALIVIWLSLWAKQLKKK